MIRVTRSLGLVFALALAAASVGCSKRITTNISVLNSSTTELRVNGWTAGQVEPGDSLAEWDASAKTIAPGDSTTIALYRPDATRDTAVVVRLVPVGFDENNPFWIQLEPPGPFVLRVRGTGGDLSITREEVHFDENQTGPGGIPLAPGERGYRGTLPPWVAR
jgi:hypothetical protein